MVLSTEAKLVPPPTNATTRESKQIMLMFPNQSIKKVKFKCSTPTVRFFNFKIFFADLVDTDRLG